MLLISKFKNLSKAFWSISEQLSTPLVYFILTPYLIGTSKIIYGDWAILITIATFSQVCNLSLTAVTARIVPSLLTHINLYNYINQTQQIIIVIGLLLASLLVSALFFIDDIEVVLFCAGSIIIISSQDLDNLYSNILKGFQKYRASTVIEVFTRIIWALGIFAGVHYQHDIITTTVLSYVLKTFIKIFIIHSFFLKKKYTSSKLQFYPFNSIKYKINQMSSSNWIWIQMLGGVAIGAGDRFFVASQLGVAVLANYLPLIQLSRLAFTFASAGSQVLLPYVSNKIANNTLKKRELTRTLIIACCFSAIPSLSLMFVSHFILEIWLGKDYADINSITLFYLAISSLLLAIFSPVHFVLMALKHDKFLAIVNVFAGFLYFFSAFFAVSLGTEALAFTKILYPLIQSLYIYKYIWYICDKK